jgi:hypothetical protein
MKTKTIYTLLLTLIILCSSCEGLINSVKPASVGEVLANASKYSQAPFYVKGRVAENRISVLGYKCFWLCDNAGNEIRVRTSRSVLPSAQEEIRLKVRIAENFAILGLSDKLLVEVVE